MLHDLLAQQAVRNARIGLKRRAQRAQLSARQHQRADEREYQPGEQPRSEALEGGVHGGGAVSVQMLRAAGHSVTTLWAQ